MVNDRLHIICGNCGQDLKEVNMATWQYVTQLKDEKTDEVIANADVVICCGNCGTLHFLSNYIKELEECEE